MSPCLAEADLMRRVLPAAQFGTWFHGFIDHLNFEPTIVPDVTDPKPYYLAGLNLSRAWMINGILSILPPTDTRARAMADLSAGIKAEHYEGGHWLGTFAVYLVTARGLT